MRLRFRFIVVMLFMIGFIIIFNGLYTVIETTEDYSVHKQREQQGTIYLTPNRAINDAGTTTSPAGLAVNYSQRIVYNRVPKCGSRSVLTLFKIMAVTNKFRVIEPAMNYPYQLGRNEQKRISDFMSALRTPFLYHRHMHYFDFKTFGGPSVAYINLIRDPVSRSVSHFYFRRYGDNLLNKTRVKNKIKNRDMTYDECVLKKETECVGNWGIFFIVPFFCGHLKECRSPKRWALNQAKKNVEKYLVVGILEEYDDFIKVLEKLLPNFFQGAYKQSKTPDPYMPPKSVLSLTRKKQKPSEKIIAMSKENMKLEYEFYDFIKERFHKLKRSLDIQ
ncbi:uronyl 2-sulfotransferase [Paramuricea clavata]|uniref:Uronyl 2-sulfotransferase n=1 Tax=Paramuricea clavata TaxID=317549 RepID=A0A7D9HQT0_PARCT|nr:uronyl 2-sulfotransferase [Paramuricea clavata]